MARFKTFDDVLRAIPGLLASRLDVHEYLQRPGVLASELRAEIQRTPPTEPIRALWPGGAGTRLPTIVRDVKPRPDAALRLPPGEYDLRVALRIELVNQTIAGVYQTHTIPHRLPLIPFVLAPIFHLDALRTVMTGIPDLVRGGDLQLTAAPSVEVVDFVEHLVIAAPIRIDFIREIEGLPFPRVVSHLSGTLRIPVPIEIEVLTAEENDGVEGIRVAFPLGSSPVPLRLVIDPDSPVQAILPGADEFFREHDMDLRSGLNQYVGGMLASPVIAIPGLDGISLKLQRGDVRAFNHTVIIGLLLGVGDDPEEPGTGDPTTLAGSSLESDGPNIRAIAHATIVDKLMRSALRSGRLQALATHAASAFQPGVSADATDAWGSIDEDGIKVRIALSITGFCAATLNVVYAIDLKPTVQNGQVVISRKEEYQGIGAWEILVCFLSGIASFGLGLVVPLLRGLWWLDDSRGGILDWVLNGFPSSEDPAPFVVSALLETTRPVPRTELRAQVQVTKVTLEREKMTSEGTAALLRDTLNAYVYAVFHQSSSDPLYPGSWPIQNAKIHLVDLDWEGLGDEVPTVPGYEIGNTIVTTRILALFPPETSAQSIATSTTNFEGRVRFALSPQLMLTRWGTARMQRTFTNRETGTATTTPPFFGPIDELAPDLYFVVERFDGTRVQTGLLAVDVRPGQRVGTADEPLRFDFGGPIIGPPR
jgi:hypothetical protein